MPKIKPVYTDGGSHNNGSAGFSIAPHRHPLHSQTSSTEKVGLIVQGHTWNPDELTNLAPGEQGVYVDGVTAQMLAVAELIRADAPDHVISAAVEAFGLTPDVVPYLTESTRA